MPEKDTVQNDPSSESSISLPIIDPDYLVGRSFLANKQDGKCLRAKIVKAIDNCNGKLARDSFHLKFLHSMKDDAIKESCACNESLDNLRNSEEDGLIE